jgi:hypothetical protein
MTNTDSTQKLDSIRPDVSHWSMWSVGLLSGISVGFVLLLVAPWSLPLSQIGLLALVGTIIAGIYAGVKERPHVAVSRTAYIVAALFLYGGISHGLHLWNSITNPTYAEYSAGGIIMLGIGLSILSVVIGYLFSEA